MEYINKCFALESHCHTIRKGKKTVYAVTCTFTFMQGSLYITKKVMGAFRSATYSEEEPCMTYICPLATQEQQHRSNSSRRVLQSKNTSLEQFWCFEYKEIGGFYLPDLLQMHILLYSKVGRGQHNAGLLWSVQCTTRLNAAKHFQKQDQLRALEVQTILVLKIVTS